MRVSAFTLAAVVTVGFATSAHAEANLPSNINEPPRGPGTEVKPTNAPVPGRVVPGWEASGQVGGGGAGFGLGARAGYTMDRGFYGGAAYTHFWGSNVATIDGDQRTSSNLIGAEIGYKIFLLEQAIEIRPFVFLGADFTHDEHPENATVSSNTGFALDPSALVAYHIGPAFVSGEVRLLLTPTPVKVAGFGGIGLSL